MAIEVEFVLGVVEEKDLDLGHERVRRRREQMMLERECFGSRARYGNS